MTTTPLALRERPSFLGALLGGFALLVCGAVALSSTLTAPLITQRQQEDTQRLLAQVLPNQAYDQLPSKEELTLTLDGTPVHFFRARQGGQVTAIALDLGYESPAAFATMFKRLLGVAPSKYQG